MAFSCGVFFCNVYRPGITHKNFQIFAGPESGMTMYVLCRHPDEGRGPLCKRVFFVDFIDLDSGVGGQDDTTSLKLRGAGKE